MSKPRTTPQNSLSYTNTETLPPLKRIKTEWDLKGLYYTSEKDQRLKKDIAATERAYMAFAKRWKNKTFTNNPKTLATALAEYEKLTSAPAASRPGRYLNFRTVLNVNDMKAEKMLVQLGNQFRKLGDLVVFFPLAIGALPQKTQKQYLKDPHLEPYRYFLERIFVSATHQLSEPEEKIMNLKSRQSYSRWVDMTEKIISNRTITFKGKTLALPQGLETLESLTPKERRSLWSILLKEFAQIGEVAEHEFNAIINDVSTEDELRGYKKPYSATALSYQDTETSIENLVSVMSTQGFTLSKKFYKQKAALHNVKKLHYTQKYQSIGPAVTVPFTQAVDICRDVFYGINNRYGATFDSMLQHGQIDVYPKKGKRGGAFMSEEIKQPTQVLLNHTDTLSSLRTLAHEMGHAIHAERGKKQRPFYQGHSITTAETASTLFENLLFDKVYEQATDAQKPVLLHDRIAQNIATMQRQIACFNCELELHTKIDNEGAMTNDELRASMQRHLQSYLGSAVTVTPEDGYVYVYWSHLRFGFYVYTYTFGLLMSTIMANNFKADKGYAKSIDTFLLAGESDTVANIFKFIDIDVTREDTFAAALENHASDIAIFAKMVQKKT